MRRIVWFILGWLLFVPFASYADDPCRIDGISDVISECTKEIQSGKRSGHDLAYVYDTRAQAWLNQAEYDKALADSNEALRLNPKWAEALLHRGSALQWKKMYDQAERDYTAVIELGQSNVQAYTMRGSVYGLTGKLDKSIADSTKAIDGTKVYSSRYGSEKKMDPDFNPDRARALFNRGLAWKRKGEYIKAIEDYKQAIRSNPGNPHAWLKQLTNWDKRSLAEQADILYKDIPFSSDMNTSDSRIYDIWDVQKTRFGYVLLVQTNISPASTVMFNGQKVFEDQGMYVGIWGYFQSKDSDVILVGSNPGGSATPDTQLSFLVINSENQAHVVSNPDFVAGSPNEDSVKSTTDKAGRIFVNFGFRAGKEMVAEFDSGKVVIHANSKKGIPLDEDDCQWLYDKGMESCTSEIARQQGCNTYASNAGVYGSVSDMSQLTYISNLPGYRQSGFNKSCLAWCNGKRVSFKIFSKATCNIK